MKQVGIDTLVPLHRFKMFAVFLSESIFSTMQINSFLPWILLLETAQQLAIAQVGIEVILILSLTTYFTPDP